MTNRVLFVDDEALILTSLKRGLFGEEYEMFFASNGEDALNILSKDEFSVLVTDMKMPGMSGLDLLKEAKKLYPNMVKIVLSGYTQLPQVLVTVNQGDIFRFITKPWDLENEFKGVIREAVDYFNYRLELIKGREALEKKNVSFQNILKSYDDKIQVVKEEVVLMRDLNAIVFKEQNRLIKHWDEKNERKESVQEKLLVLEATILEIFNLVPFTSRRFQSKGILDELKKLLTERHSLKHFELGLDSRTHGSLKGKLDLLIFIVLKIFDAFIIESYDSSVNIVISSEPFNDDEFWLRVVLQTDVTSIQWGPVQETLILLLQELAKRQGASVQIVNVNDGRAFLLKMLFLR